MSFDALHKLITYLYASLGLFIVASTAEVPLGLQLLTALGVLLSVFAEGAFIASVRYQRAHTAALVVVLAVEALRVLGDTLVFTALVESTMALAVSRLAQRRSAAEHQQIAAIAILHLLIGTIVDTGLVYAAVFVGFLVMTPWMMALTHLRGEIERKYGATSAEAQGTVNTEAITRVRAALRSRELATPRFLLGSAALALPLFLVTALFFVLFPRVGSGFLDVRARSQQSVAGFGSEVNLGSFGTIRDDPTVVIRVYPPDLGASPEAERSFRLRGTSFDVYDGTRWSHGAERLAPALQIFDYHIVVRAPDPERDLAMRIQAAPLDGPIAFLPDDTIAVRFSQAGIDGRSTVPEAMLSDSGELRLRDESVPSVIYDAMIAHDGDARLTELSARARARGLVVPAGHERVVALAERITRTATSDVERARMLVRYLRDENRFHYDLDRPDPGTTPPVVAFLFTHKRGHCEYFATSLAIMLRSVGIPTRTVTGFLGGQLNPIGRYYAIHQGDAHSWVEAYIDGAFHVYDPTPTGREAFNVEKGAFSFVTDAIDAMRARWALDVVGFDLDRQTALFRSLGGAMRRRDTAPEEARRRDEPPRWSSRLTTPILLALLVVAALVYVIRRLRARPVKPPEIVMLYNALEQALARRGHARPESRTPRAHLALLEQQGFEPIDVVRDVTSLYVRLRYTRDVAMDRSALAPLRRGIRRLSRRRR